MKSHTHFMTDDDFCISPLYNQNHHKPPSPAELDRLHRMEKQNQYLKQKNHYLTFENSLVKFKNEMIKQNEEKLRTIINEIPIPILIRSKSTVLYFNDEAQKQFHITEQNEIGEKSKIFLRITVIHQEIKYRNINSFFVMIRGDTIS